MNDNVPMTPRENMLGLKLCTVVAFFATTAVCGEDCLTACFNTNSLRGTRFCVLGTEAMAR